MVDVLTAEQRKRCMSSIGSKNTKPELVVRKLAHGLGYRYRLHAADLPGKPDLVFRRLRKVILVHGCYWHRHNCKSGRSCPATNTEVWEEKFRSNIKRDQTVLRELESCGWDRLIIWECETKDAIMLQSVVRKYLSS